MAKTRSPNYPAINLADAIGRATTVYRAEHRHVVDKDAIVRDLGYSGLNGASLPMLAALSHYGLLEKAGNGLRITDDAVTVIEAPANDPERAKAIRKLAFTPSLFEELGEAFGEEHLPSDETLRLWLLRRDYNQNAVDKVIRVYRETLGLVSEQGASYNAPGMPTTTNEIQARPAVRDEQRRQPPLQMKQDGTKNFTFSFYLPNGETAELFVPRPITKDGYDLLNRQIQFSLGIIKAVAITEGGADAEAQLEQVEESA